ncbi:hypothetical protein F751_6342 [Auxenochlorella protothecoides]|uniref:Uncharacterized protein n=1 Tax=Auxenochlorella protothecoides TaxID=3075 RepID=A0A087SS79_AUXPR|nr:hypothetical protein F751_6342 [Auxenochlorella protothecoides]KFM28583.1 hypothetical protein F751_6342 [Auxenochlorella protothecoides]
MVVRAKVIPVRISSFACWSNSAAPACICPWAPAPASLPGMFERAYLVAASSSRFTLLFVRAPILQSHSAVLPACVCR